MEERRGPTPEKGAGEAWPVTLPGEAQLQGRTAGTERPASPQSQATAVRGPRNLLPPQLIVVRVSTNSRWEAVRVVCGLGGGLSGGLGPARGFRCVYWEGGGGCS